MTGSSLAIAHSFSVSGDRAPFDSFWLQAVTPSAHYSEQLGTYSRSTHLMTQLRGILRAVGYHAVVGIEGALHEAARKSMAPRSGYRFNPLTQRVEKCEPPPDAPPS